MLTTLTTTLAAPAIKTQPTQKPLGKRLLAWIISKDQAYRDACHVKTLPEEILRDVGLTR